MSVIVFETRQAGEGAAYPVPPMTGVTLLSLEVGEVYAHI